jgi:ankyrin repeat protein
MIPLECLKTLAFQELDRRQNDVLEAQAETFEWIWENDRFCDWDTKEQGIFWISGKAGSGKSTVMKRILQELIARNTSNESNIVAGFFFNARGADMEKTREGLLRTLLVHILLQAPYLFRHILPEFRKLRDLHGSFKWHCNVLQKLFLDVLADPSIHSTVLVIDALDECLDQSISLLLEPTSEIVNLKICISSRPCTKLLQHLKDSPHRLLLEAENMEAISLYVRREMKVVRQWNDTSDEEAGDLEKKIMKMANGVFLWVELVVQELVSGVADGDTVTELRERLSMIPPDLDGLYQRMLGKIHEKVRQQARNMFCWVLFAARPLTTTEFCYALSTGSSDEFSSQGAMCSSDSVVRNEEQMQRRLISRCGGFLEVKEQQNHNIVQLIHQSARDFLLNLASSDPEISIFVVESSMAHLQIARACIRYLSFDEFNRDALHTSSRHECSRELSLLYREHPFLEYAAGNWPTHVSKAHPDQENQLAPSDQENELGNCFLRFTSFQPNLAFSFQMFWFQNRQDLFPTRFGPAHITAYFGWVDFIHRLSSHGILSLGDTDLHGRTPLHWSIAYEQGCVFETVKALIELGADVSAADENGNTPLHLAADRGNVAVVQLLLDNKAIVNTNAKNADTPLVTAAYKGFLDIIRLLIDAGADVNQQGQNGSALQAAAACGYQEVVAFILQQGVDFTMRGGRLGTALHEAAYHGQTGVVQQLLQAGFSVDTRGGDFDTPLQAAAGGCYDAINRDGCLEVARLLLENNADVNAQGGHFCTALQAAARYGYPEMIDLLLNAGADINISGGSHGSAIEAAVDFCDDDVIARLVSTTSTEPGPQQLATENSMSMIQGGQTGGPTEEPGPKMHAMFLWWDKQKTEVPSYHFIRAVERGNYHRAKILIHGVVESFKIAISLRRKRALKQLAFIARDGFTKVAKLRDEQVLGRLIRGAMAIMCHAVDKGDTEITETLASDWVITFQVAADGDDIEKPITQIVISLLGREVDRILHSGKKKDVNRLLEAGIELFQASVAIVNPLLPRILCEQLVKSWQGAIDKDMERDIEEFIERNAKEFGDTIASGLTDKGKKILAGFIKALHVAYKEGHKAVAIKLAKALVTVCNSAINANRKLLEREVTDMQEKFKAGLQNDDEESTQRLLKLTTMLIFVAIDERFSDLEEFLSRSLIHSIADTRDPGQVAVTRFVTSSDKSKLLQKRDLAKVGESLRKAARDLDEVELVKFLEHAFPLRDTYDDKEELFLLSRFAGAEKEKLVH